MELFSISRVCKLWNKIAFIITMDEAASSIVHQVNFCVMQLLI